MGSKGTPVQLPQQQWTQQNVTPNPEALAAYSQLLQRAMEASQKPYQAYGGQLVQGFSDQQKQAFDKIGGLQGVAQPYIDRASGLAMAGATMTDPSHFASNIGSYMSPYTDQVVNATMANINETNAQQQSNVVGNAMAKGAMGGDRVGIAQAELSHQQNLTNDSTLANLRNQGWLNATNELNTAANNSLQGAYAEGSLGNEALSTGLQGANALLQSGGMQQQLGQANLSTAYQQFLNQQAYPFQNLSWLSGIINGTGPNMGQSSSGMSQGYTSQLAPNPWNSALGFGTAALGLFSDERVKEDVREVGKLNDGQKLYRYRYKGHPEYHVGLIAQEVEKRHPDAVGSVDGIKTVDYREATDDAVRAHKAGGGGLSGVPYADFASGGLGGIVGGGYVPAPAQIQARGLQLPEMPKLQQPGTNSGQAGQDIKLPSADALSKAKTGLGNIGSNIGDFLSADNHDYASDLAGGLSALARGGGVRGYDDGGTVLGAPVQAPQMPGSAPGVGAPPPSSISGAPIVNPSPVQSPSMGMSPGGLGSVMNGLASSQWGQPSSIWASHLRGGLGGAAYGGPSSYNPFQGYSRPFAAGGGVRHGYDDGGTVDYDPGGLGDLIEGRSADDPTFARMLHQESGGHQFDKDGQPLTSPKGAIGVAQVMPGTAPEAAGLAGLPFDENRYRTDPEYNKALGSAYYQKQLADFGDPDKAAAAYNAGPGRLSSALARADKEGGDWRAYLPTETQGYLSKVSDGGLGAIQNSTQGTPSGGLGSVTEGRSADDGTSETAKGLFDKANVLGLPDNARMALIAAGLGMAASKSHWLGPALGEGGLEGIKAYQTQQKTGIAQQQANQSGENIKSEIATRKGQLDIGQKGIEQRAKELEMHIDQVKNQGRNIDSEIATRAAGLRETRFVPGVGWQLFDKANPDKGWQVISGPGNPASAAPQSTSSATEIGTPAPAAPSSPATSATGTQPPSSPTAEPPRGAASMMNWKPTTAVPQGYVPQNHMAIYSNPEQVKHEGEMANKAIEQNRTDARNAMPVLYRLDEMDHAIDNLPKTGFLAQGTGANERANIAKTANTFANAFHLPNIFNESSIASIENMNKDTFRLGAELSRQIGGREPGFIVQQAVQANPGVENTATGYRRIVSGLREAARYQQDRNSFMDDYYGRFGHLNGAEDAFAKANSPQKYVDRAVMSTIDPRDAQVLQKHPDQAKAFDGLYGKGSAQLVLGQGAP